MIAQATSLIFPDEKAFWLTEGWRLVPGMGERRIQSILVLRGDEIATYEKDLGPKDDYKADKFQIPSFWEYSVAEVQDIADYLREGKPMSDPEEQRDLRQAYLQQLEEDYDRQRHGLVVARS